MEFSDPNYSSRYLVGWRERCFGPIVVKCFKILRRFRVVFFRYEEAFGHQSWNIEYFARKVSLNTGKLPLMIGLLRGQSRPANLGLQRHHQSFGILLLKPKSFFGTLVRYGATWQILRHGRSWRESGSWGFLTATMEELHGDPGVTQYPNIIFKVRPDRSQQEHQYLESLGLSPKRYFCFQGRREETTNPSYAEFDRERTSSSDTYIEGIQRLEEFGVKAVRVGNVDTQCDLPTTTYDYAKERQLDSFFDIVLIANSKFFVGPGSGIQLCANAFNIPVCLVNAFPWPWQENPMRSDSIVLPKKFWSDREQRLLTIREMVELEKRIDEKEFHRAGFLEQQGLKVVSNSSVEIADAMCEMNQRLDGERCRDNFLVKDFLGSFSIGKESHAMFSTNFVLNNLELFR